MYVIFPVALCCVLGVGDAMQISSSEYFYVTSSTHNLFYLDEEPSSMLPAEIVFVSGGEHHANAGGDILAILVPPREASASSSSSSECDEFGNPIAADGVDGDHGGGSSSEVPYINIILVSGIDGTRLNSTDPAEMAAAASKMSIDALDLTIPKAAHKEEEDCILADEGYY